MRSEKSLLIFLGTVPAGLSIFARLSTFGFFYLIGMITALFFGILHLIFLNDLQRYFNPSRSTHRLMAWVGVLSFPLIFLFQFDLEEYKDSFYVYEFITGAHKSNFEFYAFYIAIFSALVYLVNLIFWKIKFKRA
ncbi:hypothetical protein [Salinimicrobium gaetbulicola]|uniref:Uncharacterized protein n=1 Tax=Salinimicrobium gaetbulicola TaxID=999702 RepID=A0ABW3IDT5_9FLAO